MKIYPNFIILFLFHFSVSAAPECFQNNGDTLKRPAKKNFYVGITGGYEKINTTYTHGKLYNPLNVVKYNMLLNAGIESKINLAEERFYLSFGVLTYIRKVTSDYIAYLSLTSLNPTYKKTELTELNLHIPLRFDFRFTRKRFSPFITTGFLVDCPLYRKYVFIYSDPSQREDGFHGLTLFTEGRFARVFCQVGSGLDYISGRWKLQVYPWYGIGTYTFTNFIPQYWQNFGASLTLLRSF